MSCDGPAGGNRCPGSSGPGHGRYAVSAVCQAALIQHASALSGTVSELTKKIVHQRCLSHRLCRLSGV
jgi:hypothetical protein